MILQDAKDEPSIFLESLLPRLAQDRLKAFMATVPGPIKEAHVIALHTPEEANDCSVSW